MLLMMSIMAAAELSLLPWLLLWLLLLVIPEAGWWGAATVPAWGATVAVIT